MVWPLVAALNETTSFAEAVPAMNEMAIAESAVAHLTQRDMAVGWLAFIGFFVSAFCFCIA